LEDRVVENLKVLSRAPEVMTSLVAGPKNCNQMEASRRVTGHLTHNAAHRLSYDHHIMTMRRFLFL
jgi:hypothetical protein